MSLWTGRQLGLETDIYRLVRCSRSSYLKTTRAPRPAILRKTQTELGQSWSAADGNRLR